MFLKNQILNRLLLQSLLLSVELTPAAARPLSHGDVHAAVELDQPDSVGQVVVPFTLYSGHIYVDVVIEGKGPFHFLFDTGAANVLSPSAARQLGLLSSGKVEARGTGGVQTGGIVKASVVQIGDAPLRDQKFYVVDLPSPANEGRTVDGLIGFEWLSRVPTRIDYTTSTLTFYRQGGLHYAGPAKVTSLRFRGRLPQVDASIDGISGRFSIDTGSNGSLSLYPGFVDKNGLIDRYHPKTKVMSAVGVGGPVYALLTRAGQLDLAGNIITRPVTFLPNTRTGASADTETAGNIGSGVLRRFTITLDYQNKRAWFEPNGTLGEPDLADRSGLRLNAGAEGFEIVFVAGDSAAALAGLMPGDVIVSANGQPVSKIDLATFRSRLKAPVGTKISIGLQSGKTAALTLKDID